MSNKIEASRGYQDPYSSLYEPYSDPYKGYSEQQYSEKSKKDISMKFSDFIKKNWKYIAGLGVVGTILYLSSQQTEAKPTPTTPTPTIKYNCSGSPNYNCIEDTNGPYKDITDCQNNCKSSLNIEYCKTPTIDQNKYIRISDYFAVHNNLWGVCSTETDYRFCIYQNQVDTDYGWSWHRGDPKKNCPDPDRNCGEWVCPTYQQIVVGDMWGNNFTRGPNTQIFPYDSNGNAIGVRAENINSWTASIDFTWPINPCPNPPCSINRNNIWANFAYDIYIMDDLGNKKDNFMVWIYTSNPSDYVGETFNDGINDYTYWFSDKGWPWHGFLLKNSNISINTHTVNLKKMLDFIKTKMGYTNWSNWKIYGHGLGSEVAGGDGKIKITRFTETLNGITVGRQ